MTRSLLVALLALAACGPNPAPPVRVMAIVPGPNAAYETREVSLETLTNATTLTGSIGKLYGGSRIVIDPTDPLLQSKSLTDDVLEKVLLKDLGGDVKAHYIDRGGVLWPADFHTWNMVSTYWNFEQSFKYFQRMYDGKPTDKLAGARVLYWAEYNDYTQNPTQPAVLDNAIYFSPTRAFVLVPFESLQKVPLAMNLGVIGHEYAHRVFNQKAYGEASVPGPLNAWQLGPFNILKALDEGLADFHGYGVTCVSGGPGCQPGFLAVSVDETTAAARNVADPKKCMTASLRNSIVNDNQGTFLGKGGHYELGSIIATALYLAANKTGKVEVLGKALITAYDDPSPATEGFRQFLDRNLSTPSNFTLEAMSNIILSHITDLDLKKQTCSELWEHLQLNCTALPCAELPACPLGAAKGTTNCPSL